MAGKKIKITKSFVDSLSGKVGDRKFYFDSEIKGFCVYHGKSGERSFYFQYGSKYGRKKKLIGKYGNITVEQARIKARELASEILLNGTDPVEEEKNKKNRCTVGEWVDIYIEIKNEAGKRTRDDKRYLGWKVRNNNKNKNSDECEYLPAEWNKRPLEEISIKDLNRQFDYISKNHSKYVANHWLASIRACFSEAWRRDLLESNPAMRIRSNNISNERDRYLDDEEFSLLVSEVNQIEDEDVQIAFYLLIGTGARLSEILNAEWTNFKLKEGRLYLPKTKSGNKQWLVLTEFLIELLEKHPKKGKYIVAGKYPNKPRYDLRRPWKKILEATGFEDVHIHDIRRTFGKFIERVAGVYAASKALRHSDIRVTAKHYLPMNDVEMREIFNKSGKLLPFKKTASK